MPSVRHAVLGVFIALCATACTRDPQAAKEKYKASAEKYAASGQLTAAAIEYRNAAEQDPRDGEIHEKLADTYVGLRDGSNAVREYTRAADLRPDDTAL